VRSVLVLIGALACLLVPAQPAAADILVEGCQSHGWEEFGVPDSVGCSLPAPPGILTRCPWSYWGEPVPPGVACYVPPPPPKPDPKDPSGYPLLVRDYAATLLICSDFTTTPPAVGTDLNGSCEYSLGLVMP
jgi:hypothetical protein